MKEPAQCPFRLCPYWTILHYTMNICTFPVNILYVHFILFFLNSTSSFQLRIYFTYLYCKFLFYIMYHYLTCVTCIFSYFACFDCYTPQQQGKFLVSANLLVILILTIYVLSQWMDGCVASPTFMQKTRVCVLQICN